MQKVKHLFSQFSLLLTTLFTSFIVHAQGSLPTVEDPSRGAGSGIRETAQNHLYDGGILVGLVIATLAFLGVAWYAVQAFVEVQSGKKQWSNFIAVVIVGVVLVIMVIWFATKASEIL